MKTVSARAQTLFGTERTSLSMARHGAKTSVLLVRQSFTQGSRSAHAPRLAPVIRFDLFERSLDYDQN